MNRMISSLILLISLSSASVLAEELDHYAPPSDASDEALLAEYLGESVAEVGAILIKANAETANQAGRTPASE